MTKYVFLMAFLLAPCLSEAVSTATPSPTVTATATPAPTIFIVANPDGEVVSMCAGKGNPYWQTALIPAFPYNPEFNAKPSSMKVTIINETNSDVNFVYSKSGFETSFVKVEAHKLASYIVTEQTKVEFLVLEKCIWIRYEWQR